MAALTTRFLHLFLVLVAIGVLDMATSPESSSGVQAAPILARSTKARVGIVLKEDVKARGTSESAFRGFAVSQEDRKTQTVPLKRIDQRSQVGNPLMVSNAQTKGR